MKAKKYTLLFLLIVLSIAFFTARVTGISDDEKEQINIFGVSTLKGLTSIRPVVILNNKAKSLELSEDDLQIQVELALRRAGVKVTERTAIGEQRINSGTLVVLVLANDPLVVQDTDIYSLNLTVELFQDVTLVRNPNIMTQARTWPFNPMASPMLVGKHLLNEAVKEQTERKVNLFLNDYLAVNAKEPDDPNRITK